MSRSAVTFDFGQTLTELDCPFLRARLAEIDVEADASRLQAAQSEAWRQYDLHCGGPRGSHPWKVLMSSLLSEGGVDPSKVDEAVEWLWTQQPECNLWRKPITGMIDLVRRIKAGGTQVAVISNSEGRLVKLAEELGWQDDFEVIADSDRLGFAKPGPQIFRWTSEAIGVAPERLIHIGDSWAADVEGILAIGGRAIWFAGATVAPKRPVEAQEGPRLRFTHSAAELEEALRSWQVSIA